MIRDFAAGTAPFLFMLWGWILVYNDHPGWATLFFVASFVVIVAPVALQKEKEKK